MTVEKIAREDFDVKIVISRKEAEFLKSLLGSVGIMTEGGRITELLYHKLSELGIETKPLLTQRGNIEFK